MFTVGMLFFFLFKRKILSNKTSSALRICNQIQVNNCTQGSMYFDSIRPKNFGKETTEIFCTSDYIEKYLGRKTQDRSSSFNTMYIPNLIMYTCIQQLHFMHVYSRTSIKSAIPGKQTEFLRHNSSLSQHATSKKNLLLVFLTRIIM